jgi:hypothetical protein
MPRTGQFHNEDTKERIRQTLIANHPTRGKEKIDGEWVPRRQRHPKGYKSEEGRKRCGDAARGKCGPLHHLYGKKVSEETKEKIRLFWVGKDHPRKGKAFTPDVIAKIKKSHTGKTGDKSSNWQGGISFLPYPVSFNNELKKRIRNRDGNRCQNPGCTGSNQKNMDVHHIDFVKENLCDTNLISLCRSCHLRTHGDRKEWTKYYQNIMLKMGGEDYVLRVG